MRFKNVQDCRRLAASRGGPQCCGYGARLASILLGLVALLPPAAPAAADRVGLSVLLEARVAAKRGVNLLLTHQRADGSWAGEAVTTAQVLICLENAPDLVGDARSAAATALAVAYLRRTVVAAGMPVAEGGLALVSPESLSAALTALARDSVSTHRELLSRGRACLLSLIGPTESPTGTPPATGMLRAEATGQSGLPVALLDALLVTEGLQPTWTRAGYDALTARLREALRALPPAPSAAPPAGPPAEAATLAPESASLLVPLVRALLCLGVNPSEPLLASTLAGLAQAPPGDPVAAFALAEALSLVRADAGGPLAASLAGWRERLIEVLLGAQQGDGGWPAATDTVPRDRSTALALRAIQVAAGRYLADADLAPP